MFINVHIWTFKIAPCSRLFHRISRRDGQSTNRACFLFFVASLNIAFRSRTPWLNLSHILLVLHHYTALERASKHIHTFVDFVDVCKWFGFAIYPSTNSAYTLCHWCFCSQMSANIVTQFNNTHFTFPIQFRIPIHTHKQHTYMVQFACFINKITLKEFDCCSTMLMVYIWFGNGTMETSQWHRCANNLSKTNRKRS